MGNRTCRYLLLVPAAFTLVISWSGMAGASPQVVRGSGRVVTEERVTGGFGSVAVHVTGDLDITIGDREELRIEAEDNLVEYIVTEVIDDVLIFNQPENTRLKSTKPIRFFLTTRRLDGIVHAAGGRIYISRIESGRLTIQHRGSGRIQIDDLELKTLSVHASGSGRVELDRASASRCQLTQSGSGRVSIRQLTGLSNDVRLTGSGDVSISDGSIVQQTVFASGSGDFEGIRLITGVTDVMVSGSGSASVHAKDQLDATITGDGNILYGGNPQIVRSISGRGELKKSRWRLVF